MFIIFKYNVGDKFIDKKSGEVIEIIECTPETQDSNKGYEITSDGCDWDYGVTEEYLDVSTDKIE